LRCLSASGDEDRDRRCFTAAELSWDVSNNGEFSSSAGEVSLAVSSGPLLTGDSSGSSAATFVSCGSEVVLGGSGESSFSGVGDLRTTLGGGGGVGDFLMI